MKKRRDKRDRVFSIRGIGTEVKRIRWPKPEEIAETSGTVIIFTGAFAIFFALCTFLSAELITLF